MAKTFVIDTSVLLFDPTSILKFGPHKVCVPLVVIEELDRFKKDPNENGRNAREFARIVDGLKRKGSLSKGIKLDSGGTFVVSVDASHKNQELKILDLSINDNLILSRSLKEQEEGNEVILVSKDINLRIKGDALGVSTEDYGQKEFTADELYSGQMVLELSDSLMKEFESERFLPLEKLKLKGVFANQYMIINEEGNPGRRLLGRYDKKKKGLVPLIRTREGVWGIYPKNMEQQFALDALLNNEVKLVTLTGKAGTGKTLMAIAAGLEMVLAKKEYTRLLVSRPVHPMGKDLGYLPGDIEDKLGPWMQPIFDNMDFLFGSAKVASQGYEDLIQEGLLHIEALTYIRGRSIPGQYLIVDEAQNLTPHEVKTIITRAGEGTKIVLTGDVEQIDSPYLDSVNNGLAYCIDRLKEEAIVGHTALKVGERSELSEIASKLL